MKRPDAALTHLGFYVRDLPTMARFYQDVMGMVVTDEGEAGGRSWAFMSRDPGEHHQVVLATGRPPEAFQLINQISFRLKSLDDLRTYYAQLEGEGVTGLEAVTHGNSWSVYFLDPEGNRIELYAKSPWYVSQPLRVGVDMRKSVEELHDETDVMTRDDPSRIPIGAWEVGVRARIQEANG
jgi:catechol-2,3-dioxygenase